MINFNRGNLNLDHAVRAYAEGHPVIVKTGDGFILHGEETLKAIIDTGIKLECVVIHGVPSDDWNNSEWPEVLAAAQEVFMKQGGFTVQRAG